MPKLKAVFPLLLLALLVAVVPVGGARPDYQIAGILRGEAPVDCEACRQITAFALLDDVDKGVYLPGRWYGFRQPRDEDYAMIAWARENRTRNPYPRCKFVGSGRDLETWARKGWIEPDVEVIAYCSGLGCTVCVPEPVVPKIVME